jgi:acyl-CoA thioester hydrolase
MHEYRLQHRVSHADVDFLGELKVSALLGLLEQAAVEASRAVGFDAAWYTREGRIWIIRRTRLERTVPVGGGDVLEVTTSVVDYRRARSLRQYGVSRISSDGSDRVQVAHATTDWVYCDLATGRPVTVPEPMRRAFSGDDLAALPRAGHLAASGQGPATELDLTVRPSQLDHMAHVNNAVYASFLEDGAFALFAARGWTLERMLDLGGALRIRRLDAEYLDDATAGDRLAVRSWLAEDHELACEPIPIRPTSLVQAIARDDASVRSGTIMRAASEWSWRRRPPVVGGVPQP